ncbi:M15 family metallopeptidase [Subtercola boreus]|uniref:M15 family metallopeptidase n=1 Tax=Subtercola boreus TaxID=120213 RepID=UPI00209C5468|nr:M15 family metallopeptidase [Subtercola boreus]
MSDAVPPDRRPRSAEGRAGSPLSRETPQAPDDRRRQLRRRRILAAVLIVVVIAAFVGGTVIALNAVAHQFQAGAAAAALPAPTESPSAPSSTPSVPPSPSDTAVPAAPTAPPVPPAFDKTAHSIDDPNSIWVVVNKQRPLADGANFVPPNLVDLPRDMPDPLGYMLRSDAADALHSMFAADKAEVGTQLIAQSGYRDYSVQVRAYQHYKDALGVAGADKTSARPGFSEHQTGLAMDIMDTSSGCDLETPCFGSAPSGVWLAANAYRFGFILRYPADKTAVTGYEYEPWHFRFVGVDLATEMHNTGVETLEEFFGLPAAPDYAG